MNLNVLTAAMALGLLAGCATAPSSTKAPATTSKPGTPSLPPLASVRPSLHTLEDSLILDIVLGYQDLSAGRSDRETLRRARSAQNQLEYMLRHGGIKDRGGEGRVLEIPAGEKATLGELTAQMSRELMRLPAGEAEAERAREVRRHRMNLSYLVEDAEWVLAVNAAMDGPLSETDKRNLRRLQEAYTARAPHGDISAQVTTLLQTIKDERLHKELKKLANRSWERERRGPEATSSSTGSAKQTPSAPAAPALTSAPSGPPAPLPDFDSPSTPAGSMARDSAATPAAIPEAATDSLTSPDRFCEERRAEAASTFAAARSANGEPRKALLRQSLALLDECLTRYPTSQGAEKARGNRERVQKELETP